MALNERPRKRWIGCWIIFRLATSTRKARLLSLDDFEDAVVATVAKASGSALIVTRNVEDFAGSPVPAISPADLLGQFPAKT